MARMMSGSGVAYDEASKHFWLVDKMGLVTKERKELDPEAEPFARSVEEIRSGGLKEGASVVEVVKAVKPDVLLGLSGVGGIFSKEVLEAMRQSTCSRPAIFPMSNPTKNAECTAEEAFRHVGPHIIFASGSPFEDVDLGNGKIGHSNQGNNMYLFPGIGLGTLLSGARVVSDGMLQAAAECLAAYMKEEDVLNGAIYPSISCIRGITKEVAAAVMKEAVIEGLAEGYRETDAKEMAQMSDQDILKHVERNMWSPTYSPLVCPR